MKAPLVDSRARGRSPILRSLGLFLLAHAACTAPDRGPLDARGIRAARRALELLPAAIDHLHAGRYGKAEAALSAVLGALPGAEHGSTAAAVLDLGDGGEYRRLLAAVETNLGLARFRARRYEPAVEALDRAVALDPRSRGAWLDLGIALLHAQRFDAAREALGRAREHGAGGARFELHAGRAAWYSGHARAGRECLLRAVELGEAEGTIAGRGTRLEAEVSLAELDAAAGDLTGARRRLEAVLAATPNDPLPRYRLLGVLARLGEAAALAEHRRRFEADAAAMAAVQDALGRRPDEVENLRWIADAYLRLGLDHLAEVHYRQLLVRDPEDREARRALAELAYRQAPRGPASPARASLSRRALDVRQEEAHETLP